MWGCGHQVKAHEPPVVKPWERGLGGGSEPARVLSGLVRLFPARYATV